MLFCCLLAHIISNPKLMSSFCFSVQSITFSFSIFNILSLVLSNYLPWYIFLHVSCILGFTELVKCMFRVFIKFIKFSTIISPRFFCVCFLLKLFTVYFHAVSMLFSSVEMGVRR